MAILWKQEITERIYRLKRDEIDLRFLKQKETYHAGIR